MVNARSLARGDKGTIFVSTRLLDKIYANHREKWEAANHYPAFLRTVGAAVSDGRVRYREDTTDGFENASAAFIGMLEGRNFGKALVRVIPSV